MGGRLTLADIAGIGTRVAFFIQSSASRQAPPPFPSLRAALTTAQSYP